MAQAMIVRRGGGIALPNGATAIPVDDWRTWVKCAALDPDDYADLPAVIASDTALVNLMGTVNAVDYMIRSTATIMSAVVASTTAITQVGLSSYAMDACIANATWAAAALGSANAIAGLDASFPIIVPDMTGYDTPSGRVTVGDAYDPQGYYPWGPFSSNTNVYHSWLSGRFLPQWLLYEFSNTDYPDGVWPYKLTLKTGMGGYGYVKDFTIQGSNDFDSTNKTGSFTTLGAYSLPQTADLQTLTVLLPSGRFKVVRIHVTATYSPYQSSYSTTVNQLQFYCK